MTPLRTRSEVLAEVRRLVLYAYADAQEAHEMLRNSAPWRAWCDAGNVLTETAVRFDPRGWATVDRPGLSRRVAWMIP